MGCLSAGAASLWPPARPLRRDFVVPELLQHDATPRALADATLAWLAAPEKTARLRERFTGLHRDLRRDTATLASDAIAALLDDRR